MSDRELKQVQQFVNDAILDNEPLHVSEKNLQEAMDEGAMALFVRNMANVFVRW